MRNLITMMALTAAGPLAASDFVVPSGHTVTLFDVIMEDDLARFRFVLPDVAQGVKFIDIVEDFQYICDEIAVPALRQSGRDVAQTVISISAEQVAFGQATDVTQYFQPFAIAPDGACTWEEF